MEHTECVARAGMAILAQTAGKRVLQKIPYILRAVFQQRPCGTRCSVPHILRHICRLLVRAKELKSTEHFGSAADLVNTLPVKPWRDRRAHEPLLDVNLHW